VGQEVGAATDIEGNERTCSGRRIVDSVSIGLDIGSSAVRAAEIEIKQGRRTLRRYAQVGLPHGYVVDGEIINIPGVSATLRRLWSEVGFSSTDVVVGVSGPRVFVRQADVPALNADDLRSSLKFDGQELIPIPMEEAGFDFSVIDAAAISGNGTGSMRILIVAAHRDVLRTHLATLKGAGLNPVAMDAAPLALMRAVPGGDGSGIGAEVLVSIGAELTTVAVRQGGIPRFIRSLTVGGANLTEVIASTMHLELASAERLKRGAVPSDAPQLAQARKAMSVEMRDLAEDVRATVDFFMGQSDGTTIERLLLTGGASQTEGLAAAIGGGTPASVLQIDPFSTFTIGDLGLDADALPRASATATTAIGLALWPFESPVIRLSVLPEEVAAARRARKLVVAAGTGVAGLCGLLGLVGVGQFLRVQHAETQVRSDKAQVTALSSQVSQLQAATAEHVQVQSRATMVVTALQGDIDWVRVLGQIAGVMPPSLSLTTFSGGRNVTASGASAASTTPGVGTLSFTVQGHGGLPAVAAWLKGLQRDHALEGTWVTGIAVTSNGGAVTFSSTSNLTNLAQSNRAQKVTQ
jgi:type IV pilus assembly protein PilM